MPASTNRPRILNSSPVETSATSEMDAAKNTVSAPISHFPFLISSQTKETPPSRDGGASILRGTTLIPRRTKLADARLSIIGALSRAVTGVFPSPAIRKASGGTLGLHRRFTDETQER